MLISRQFADVCRNIRLFEPRLIWLEKSNNARMSAESITFVSRHVDLALSLK